MRTKSSLVFALLAVWLSFQRGLLADDPTKVFNTTTIEDSSTTNDTVKNYEESLKNQFIIQFERNEAGERSKQSVLNHDSVKEKENDDELEVIRRIESLNIAVVKFRNSLTALEWQKSKEAEGIKYFERGEKGRTLFLTFCNNYF